MAFIASALALRSTWQVQIRAAFTLGVVWTGYLFTEADQCPTLQCSGQPVVLTCYCGCVVRMELAQELGIFVCPSPYPRMRYWTRARPSSSWQRGSHIYNLLAGAESLCNGTLFPSIKVATQTNKQFLRKVVPLKRETLQPYLLS